MWNLEIGLHNFTLILQTFHFHSMSDFLSRYFLDYTLPLFSPGAVPARRKTLQLFLLNVSNEPQTSCIQKCTLGFQRQGGALVNFRQFFQCPKPFINV